MFTIRLSTGDPIEFDKIKMKLSSVILRLRTVNEVASLIFNSLTKGMLYQSY